MGCGNGHFLLTAIYVGQELRGVLSDTRFLRVFEHGTLAGSDVISEFFHVTSKRSKGVICTPFGRVVLERRLLAVLPPDADKVNLAEGLWLAIFFLLFDAWVLNTSPTGSSQRFLVESWDGTVALAEQLGTSTLEQRGIQWASRCSVEDDPSAFMRRALAMTRRLLQAGLWVDKDDVPVAPHASSRSSDVAIYSWLQCFNALIGHRATRKAHYAVWAMACSDPDCRNQVKSPICVHGLYAIHRHIQLGREPCLRCSDHEMYFAPPATTESSVMPFAASSRAAKLVPPDPISDAECLLQCAASVSSLAFQLPSFGIHGLTTAAEASNWMLPEDRRALDHARGILHRLALQHEKRASGAATSFSGTRTSIRRLQTAKEVAHSHASARGVEAGDPGPCGLLRRHVARLPGAAADPTEGDAALVVRATQEAGQLLSAFVAQLSTVLPPRQSQLEAAGIEVACGAELDSDEPPLVDPPSRELASGAAAAHSNAEPVLSSSSDDDEPSVALAGVRRPRHPASGQEMCETSDSDVDVSLPLALAECGTKKLRASSGGCATVSLSAPLAVSASGSALASAGSASGLDLVTLPSRGGASVDDLGADVLQSCDGRLSL